MTFLKIIFVCTILSRCPCCGAGKLFGGWFAFRSACASCGLVYEQWVGDWTSATWIAHSLGFLGALGVFAWMFVTGTGMNGPVAPQFSIALLAILFSLASLRPSKALWLGFMYWAGGVEVSAKTRARLQWFSSGGEGAGTRWMRLEAQSRAVRPSRLRFPPPARFKSSPESSDP